MPIPKPNSGESETDFMARCMDSSTMRNEYSQRDQRVAVCLSSYRDGKKETVMDDAPAFDGSEEVKFVEGHIDCEADFELKAYHDDDDDENKGMFEGYASVFGNKDLGNDVVQAGAFRKSLRGKSPKKLKCYFSMTPRNLSAFTHKSKKMGRVFM